MLQVLLLLLLLPLLLWWLIIEFVLGGVASTEVDLPTTTAISPTARGR